MDYLSDHPQGKELIDRYRTSAQKEQFARDIVKTFPILKDTTPGMEGHIHEMKYTPPTKVNKSRILSLFKETHHHRRNWLMQKTVDITTFLQEYPRMQDMPELVNVEFQQLYPDNHSAFLRKWESFYVPRILQIALEEYPSITSTVKSFDGGDQNLCAAVVLAHMLFRTSKKVSSRADAIKYLYQTVPLGTDLADEARRKDVCYKQPFLLAVGPLKQPTQYVMVVDQLSIPAGDSPVTAIDALFKAYYCFNVEFPISVSQFWEFLAFEVNEVMDKKEAKPQVRSLASIIRGLAAK
ncbi:hypothetical protein HOLleu_45176 [Holothuria leucospilota]|uniref:Uncharacterized protein n=1 Tax=Holothuria leucospilota TaxID=206669 RepID=A0A9Q0YBT2_HOLLE|nr:hypothetical protein HOLleu_45176 [Holothuria leucospilota]